MYKVINELAGSYSSHVYLIEIAGKNRVLKKTEDKKEVLNEYYFHRTLKKHHIPSLEIFALEGLHDNEIILEYIEGSPTLAILEQEEHLRKLGAILSRMHQITHHSPAAYMDDKLVVKTHKMFITEQITYGIKRVTEKGSDLKNNEIGLIVSICKKLLSHVPSRFSLVHGDLHMNNILVSGDNLYLFDVHPTIRYADPYRDLSLIMISFPNQLYINTNKQDYLQDAKKLSRIKEGYTLKDMRFDDKILDLYVLLRAFTRYPNPFEWYLKDIMLTLIEKHS